MEAGSVLAGLRPLAAQLHPVLHQVQRLHEHRGAHPAKETGPETGGPDRLLAELRRTAPPAGEEEQSQDKGSTEIQKESVKA